MNVLQICDYAARYRGNFIEPLDYLKNSTFDKTDKMYFSFPTRMLERNNAWYAEFEKDNDVLIYGKSAWSKIIGFRKFIKKNKIDIVHTHFTDLKTDLCVKLACAGLSVKKLKHYRSSFGTFSKVKRMAASLCYHGWSAIFCVSPHIEAEAKRNISSCKTLILYNAVYFPRLDEYEKIERASWNIPEDAVLCFAIGYDYRLKGIDLACEAVAKLRKKTNAYLAVSVASNADKITEQITQQFGEFPEWVKIIPPRQDIASYYKFADIYIQASRSEGFCSAIVEAAYCGKIVVASDCPGMLSHAQPNFDFLWYKNGDAEALAEKLEQAVIKKDDIELLERNRQSAIDNYGIDSMAKKLYQIYKDITKRR